MVLGIIIGLAIFILIVIVLLVFYYILTYNKLVVLENRIDNAWSQIDVQLKKRADLIPNLVNTVKGYAKHEKGVFTEVTKARANLMKSKNPETRIKNNQRQFGQQIEVRCWQSIEARTATPTRLSFDILENLADRIIREVPDIVSVTYNITPKPPSTIEAV